MAILKTEIDEQVLIKLTKYKVLKMPLRCWENCGRIFVGPYLPFSEGIHVEVGSYGALNFVLHDNIWKL